MSNSDWVRLTETETLILRCLINGDGDKAVAQKTGIGFHALRKHDLSQLYCKLGVSNRTQAAVWGWKRGLRAMPGET